MSTYYHYDEELIGAGMQPGEIALYIGTKLDGLRGGPSTCSSSNISGNITPGHVSKCNIRPHKAAWPCAA